MSDHDHCTIGDCTRIARHTVCIGVKTDGSHGPDVKEVRELRTCAHHVFKALKDASERWDPNSRLNRA